MRKTVTFQGSVLTTVGRPLQEAKMAPDFKVVSVDLKEVTLEDFEGKIKIITSFPSIDTPVCDLQVKEFNKRASGLHQDIVILCISKDLPFAQQRFCQANSIEKVKLLSDYKFSSFGINYGFLIKELNLLARTVVILDKNDIVRYIQVVGELTDQPDYDDAVKNIELVVSQPQAKIDTADVSKCKPCEGDVPALPKETVSRLLVKHRGWDLVDDKKLVKTFKYPDFVEAKYFVDLVSVVAEEQGHHPTLTIIYNKVKITLTTHAAGGLTDNDFIMAKIIDQLTAQ